MDSLYLDEFEEKRQALIKEAGFIARLGDATDSWPQELSSELYRQLPFLSDYDVNVVMDKVDQQKGMGFGYADIHNKTERPEMEHEEVGLPHLRIPMLIQDRAVKPFSVMLDGESVMPLTEDRVREILFNPATFDLSTNPPRDPSLVEPLMPPQRSGIGMGGEYKMASADPLPTPQSSGVELPYQVSKYRGHPDLLKRAIELERQFLALDKDQTPNTASIKPVTPAEKAHNKKRSELDYKRRSLELDLAAKLVKEKKAYEIKPEDRKNIPKKEFAQPGKKSPEGGGKGKYPIPDAQHYRTALGFAKMHGDMAAYADIKRRGAAMGYGDGAKEKTSQKGSLLLAIAPTIDESDRERFIQKLSNDHTTQAGLRRAGIMETLVQALDETKTASSEERLLELAERIQPTVVTLQKLPGGDFLVKSANVHAFVQKTAAGQVVPQQEAAEAIGPQNAQAMQPGQTATVVSQPAEVQDAEVLLTPPGKVIEEFGEYKVQDMMGNQLLGWVFPKCIPFDGNFQPIDMAVFTNGSAYAAQDHIAGELVGKGANLPVESPRGDGVFYAVKQGEGVCTAPITIRNSMMGPDGEKFVGTDVFGNEVVISLVEGLKNPMRVGDNEFGLPDWWKFLRLNNQIQVAQDPTEMMKQASIRAASTMVTLFYNGGYHLRGGCGLDKLSSDLRQDLGPVEAEFMLGLLGVDGVMAKQKVAEARKKGSVKLAGLHTIKPLGERYAEAEKTASAILVKFPNLKRDMIKEAAMVEDAQTIDSMLALNFLNPENLEIFIEYIPELEQCSEKLAEMLLYSYLGQKELPEGPIERSMKNLEEVAQALKNIAGMEPG